MTDWRGNITIPKRTPEERHRESLRIAASIVAERKRKDGTNAGKVGTPWAKAIHCDVVRARIEGVGE